MMNTLDLKQASTLLNMHPMTLRRLAANGQVPAARAGRAWIFIEDDLLNWIRSQYPAEARAAGSTGENPCPSTDVQKNPTPTTGVDSQVLTESRFDDLQARRAELMRSDSSDS